MLELEKDVSEKQASTTCWKVKADGGGHSTWQGTGSMSEVSQWRRTSGTRALPALSLTDGVVAPRVPDGKGGHEVGSLGMKQLGLRFAARYLAMFLPHSLGGIPHQPGNLGICVQRVWKEAPDSFASPEERRERHRLL